MSRRIALIYGPETPDGQAVVTSDYVVGTNDAVIAADASTDNPLIVTLPLAATRTLKSEVTVVKIDSSANPVSVIVQGADTISGVTSVNLSNQWDSLVVEAAGTGRWLRIQSGGGGTSDHGALTGLADDDHTQYALSDGSRGKFQVAEPDQTVSTSTNFATAGIEPGFVLYDGSGGDTLTLPSSNVRPGQTYLIVAGPADVTVAAASGEFINGYLPSYPITNGNVVAFVAYTGGVWYTGQRAGSMFDLPDLSTATTNDVLQLGSSGLPEWTDTVNLVNYSLVAADIPSLDAGKITTGTFATGRIPKLGASSYYSSGFYHFTPSEMISPGTFGNTTALTSGNLVAHKIVVFDDVTLNGAKMLVRTLGAAGAKLQAGIYASSGGRPNGAPLVTTGEIDLTTGTIPVYKNPTFSSVTLTAGTYFVVYWLNDTTTRIQLVDPSASGTPLWPIGTNTDTLLPSYSFTYASTYSSTMPTLTASNFSLVNSGVQNAPLWIKWKVA